LTKLSRATTGNHKSWSIDVKSKMQWDIFLGDKYSHSTQISRAE